MDFPGHGLSSHRPPGLHYDSVQYVMDIKHMADGKLAGRVGGLIIFVFLFLLSWLWWLLLLALKWRKFSIVAHSMGELLVVVVRGSEFML